LPAGPELPGEPALALAGSAGWRPNADAALWFMKAVWPHIARAFPRARLHLFGGRDDGRGHGVASHPAPVDSLSAFPLNGLCVVPLHAGSGIRMRILEAWARGLPVIATTIAARGLDVVSGRELVIADSAEQFVAAIERLTHDAGFRQALIAAGRDYLRTRHDPAAATDALVAAYRAAIESRAGESASGKPRT
jgi:glycosyltransferase involved in cell wall biosynthesis